MDKRKLIRSANKYFGEAYTKWYYGSYHNVDSCPNLTMALSIKNNIRILPKIYTNGIN